MSQSLENSLQKMGLSDKSARVYLASLELGPSPVQAIAKKAQVNRPTAYVMIDLLTERGLMSSFEKGKKRFFKAESPDQLLTLVTEEKRNLDQKEEVVKKIIPDLKKLLSFSEDKPGVSYYEGLEGVKSLREDVIRSGEQELFELVPVDEVRKYIPEEAPPDDLRHEIKKKLKIKSVYTSKRGAIYKEHNGNVESRYISPSRITLESEIIIYGDKAAIFTFSGKPTGVMVHSKEIATTLRSLFQLAWSEAERTRGDN